MSIKPKRQITESQKKTIAGRQNYKCKGNIYNYSCPLYFNGRDGTFDESGYEIDHIEEFSIQGNEKLENLQALCLMCHRVKTIRFNQQKLIIKKSSVLEVKEIVKNQEEMDLD